MDPYIESPVHWPDFHNRFINALSETIADALPEPYFARIQEDTVLLEPEPPNYKIIPDVLIGAEGALKSRPAEQSAVSTLEPVTLTSVIPLDPYVEYHIEIVRLPEAEAVTVIEVLSPTNKSGSGRGFYSDKRGRLLRSHDVNIVEFDLLRAGRRLHYFEPFPQGDYHALVSRAERRPKTDVYSWSVRDRLPKISIPLRQPDPDVTADLQQAFSTAYDRGRYARFIPYTETPPAPAFSEADELWVRSVRH